MRFSVAHPTMRLEPSPKVKRVYANALPKVLGFLRVLRFPATGKVDRVGWVIRANSNWCLCQKFLKF